MKHLSNVFYSQSFFKAVLGCLLAFLLACQLPLNAFAENNAEAEDGAIENDNEKPAATSLIETLFPNFEILALISPGLLANSGSSDAAQNTPADDDNQFDYSGTYSASIEILEEYKQLYSITNSTLMSDQCVALARSGATLLFVDGQLVKLGDATDPSRALEYGTNSVLCALGGNTHALLVNSLLESGAKGAPAIVAVDNGLALPQNVTIDTSSSQSSALVASFGGTILANALKAQTSGDESPALSSFTENANISAANSSFATSGQNSPLVSNKGRVELDNVSGIVEDSPLALIRDTGSVIVHSSRLVSNQLATSEQKSQGGAIMMYREGAQTLESLRDYSVFQASDSSIRSDIESGSLFYLTNTNAKIILSNTSLEFDGARVPLLTAVGNNNSDWGTKGSNGASATLTALNQTLQGDVIVDAQSSVDLFLLEASTWRGAAKNITNTAGSLLSDQLNINIDSNSTWVVPNNSKVTNLNLAPGARLIDPLGKGVKIYDGNGFSLVDGASDISVTVTGSFSSTVKTTYDNIPEGSKIDRSAFDNTFGLKTAFGTNESSIYTPEKLRVSRLAYALQKWFANL